MGNDPVTLTPLVGLPLELSVARFGKVNSCLGLRFTHTFIYDQDVATWPLLHTTTNSARSSAQPHLQSRAMSLREDTQGDVSSSGSPHLLPSQLHPMGQFSKAPTWKLHSVSPGSLHTLAKAV